MKNYELIDYCRSRDSEVCNDCECRAECRAFFKKYGYLPLFARNDYYTDEEIEVERR